MATAAKGRICYVRPTTLLQGLYNSPVAFATTTKVRLVFALAQLHGTCYLRLRQYNLEFNR